MSTTEVIVRKEQVTKARKPRGKRGASSNKFGDDVIPKAFAGPIAQTIYRVVRTIDGNNITQSNGGDVNGAVYFALSSLDNYTDFTSLFDQYRIVCVEIFVRPLQNNSQYFSTSTDILPRFASVIDYDDASALSTLADYRQFQTYHESNWNQYQKRIIRPRVALAAYTGTFVGFANAKSTWIDLATPSVQHYGWKYFVSSGTAGTQTHLQTWMVEYKYMLEFRQVR